MNLYSAVQICMGTAWRFRRSAWHVGTTAGMTPNGRLVLFYAGVPALGTTERAVRWHPSADCVLADDYEVLT